MAKTFHRIWFGDAPVPEAYDAYWAAWQRQYPECEFVTWTDADIDKLERTAPLLKRLASPICRADVARYEILHKFGGIYLDSDILPHMHFDFDRMTADLTVCNEDHSTRYCSIGFIGAPAGHAIFDDLIEHLLIGEIDETRPNVTTGPWLFGKHLANHPHNRLPTAAFYPYLYDEPLSSIRRKDLDSTFGVHVWGGGWLAPELRKKKAMQLLGRGDIVEPFNILNAYDDEWSQDAKHLIQAMLEVREKSVQVAAVMSGDLAIDPADKRVFEFGKVLQWLLEQDADRMVWQIGAADGILVDPLRPAMVNFDPPALLLEPNPYMFAMLQSGYANNRNATLLPIAYALDDQPLVLNAINPDKAAALGLPRWVLGISSVYDDKNAIGGLTITKELTAQIATCIERIEVPVVGFDALVAQAGGRQPDVLVIDAEGMDKPIIDDILNRGCRPAILHFEIQCMDEADQQALTASLSEDYLLLQFGNDVTAYRQDVVMEYAQANYVYNGIPTIYAGALRSLNGL